VFTRYIKVSFFRGADLDPLPPVGSKDPNTRYGHIEEGGPVDERQLADWIRQAATIPGWIIGGRSPAASPSCRAPTSNAVSGCGVRGSASTIRGTRNGARDGWSAAASATVGSGSC